MTTTHSSQRDDDTPGRVGRRNITDVFGLNSKNDGHVAYLDHEGRNIDATGHVGSIHVEPFVHQVQIHDVAGLEVRNRRVEWKAHRSMSRWHGERITCRAEISPCDNLTASQ